MGALEKWKKGAESFRYEANCSPVPCFLPALIGFCPAVFLDILSLEWMLHHCWWAYFLVMWPCLFIAAYYRRVWKHNPTILLLMVLFWPIGIACLAFDLVGTFQYVGGSILSWPFIKLHNGFAWLLDFIADSPAAIKVKFQSKPKVLELKEATTQFPMLPEGLQEARERGYREPVICVSCGANKPIQE